MFDSGESMQFDLAETKNIQELISRIGEGLDQFLKFEHPDAVQTEAIWRGYLDRPLPQHGVGIDQVVEDLLKQVIPNGSSVPKPGFSSFITTGATSACVLASTAASIASPQRYGISSFNLLEEVSLRWLASMCHIGRLQGVYSSGGSVANLLA
jgi:aromatic-L-amino-acid decarboxylase